MSTDGFPTLRASLAEGRQAALVEGRRKLIVRIFDESPLGFRVATIQPSMLAEGCETVLHVEGCEVGVCVVGKKLEGRRLMFELARLNS